MKRALIDLSSVIWTCLLAGKDTEFGQEVEHEGKKVLINSASYGYENAMQHVLTAMTDLHLVPRDLIFVVEGKNSKAGRQALHAGYKVGRDKLPGQYEQFNLCKQQVLDAFCSVGAQAVWQDGGVEADDVIGYLAQHLKGEVWIVSGDKDLAQCVGGNVHHWRAGAIDRNPFGPFPHDLIPVCIALVGDTSDKIPGARGFGEKAFENLLLTFGDDGLRAMKTLIQKRRLIDLQEDVGELKALQKVIDDAENVYLSYELGRLRTEKVNTLRRPLEWRAGMVKPREEVQDERLRKFAGRAWLVSAENFADSLAFFEKHVRLRPEVALDIETSTPPESDEWLERLGKTEDRTPVDVFGSTLTGMGITFGANMENTFYLTVDHLPEEGVTNIGVAEVVQMLTKIPTTTPIIVHNAAFELPVCQMSFGHLMPPDDLHHGFLPNVIDTRIMSSYADENRSHHLKSLSKELLGYDQQTYQQTVTQEVAEHLWDGTGRVISKEEVEPGLTRLRVERKMNELTASHVFSYGADDPICTSAIANHFRTILEVEDTWDIFMEVEQYPAYVTAKAFIDGADFSLEEMREMEKDDDVAYDKAWATLRAYLMDIGFEGTQCPVFDEITAATIKEAHLIVTGRELKTQVRTPAKLAKLIVQASEEEPDADEGPATLLAFYIDNGDLAGINELVKSKFVGEPQLNLGSPKQMTALLYDHMKLPVNIINDCTPKEKQEKPDLADAVARFKRMRAGHDAVLTDADMALVRKKAKADDTAIEFALAFDADVIDERSREALLAIGTMKKVTTRRSLFYKNYWVSPHWKDGKIHASANQCAAVTRRYSMSNPNLQQLPKKGEAVRFRGCFKPHHKEAVICSIDYTGQELRLAAERSQDKNMLACYIGDSLKDIHSITAAGAMRLKWGAAAVNDAYGWWGEDLKPSVESDYTLFVRLRKLGTAHEMGKKADDLRKDSKNVNFAAQFGGQAAKLSETLIMKLEDARLFLEARSAMFPDVDKAAKRAEEECLNTGYARTMMGARRHLRHAILSDDKWEVSRAARQAWNMEIQGSAGEMTKLGLARLWRSGALYKYDVRFLAPIHDELVDSVHKDHAVEYIKIKHACMTGPYANMSVPILGSISIGPDFAQQIECGDDFNEENIRKALGQIFEERAAA